MLLDIGFDLVPVSFIITDFFAGSADRDKAAQCLDFRQGFLKLSVRLLQFTGPFLHLLVQPEINLKIFSDVFLGFLPAQAHLIRKMPGHGLQFINPMFQGLDIIIRRHRRNTPFSSIRSISSFIASVIRLKAKGSSFNSSVTMAKSSLS